MTVLALRPVTSPPEQLGLRDALAARAHGEGHTPGADPALCLYRFHAPTAFVKAATRGVTLGVVAQGAKQVRVGGQVLTADPQHMVLMTREVEHRSQVFEASPARPYLGAGLCFSPDQVARALLDAREAGARPTRSEPAAAFVLPFDPKVTTALTRYCEALDDPMERKLVAPLIAEEILFRVLRTDAAAAVVNAAVGPPDAPRILEAMHWIRANLARPLSVPRIAREVAMSPSHFAHRFSAVARMSPMRYLREVRLEHARTLLMADGARANEVGTRVGFESASHFTREFKRRFGSPPAQYARQRD